MPKKKQKRERITYDDIKVVIMNPECIPIAEQRMFDFFYDRFLREQAEKELKKSIEKNE
ncbi:hypothetical protein KM799_14900 [Clostridium tyrobutyricum]|uniref:hypothetical protein n=1 Tax=Clostridium tyrobutyricum TaxID=1519 RepID=UPI001C3937ED|nr:hypothetical protein [Clostridium tyrobutyricum]MBV4447883.1 hypothetical protein [Clostridium tyrobutyricum]